jgi:predicted restriction endonuclease
LFYRSAPATYGVIEDGGYTDLIEKVAKKAEDEGYFDPNPEDERERKLQAIVHRRGQPKFRRKLIEAYAGCCAVTGYDSVRALEAAHIKDYMGPDSNHVKNGLLLRADIHTLFDLGDLAINPETYEVVVSDQLVETRYSSLAGLKLSLPEDTSKHPSKEALEEKWSSFKQ